MNGEWKVAPNNFVHAIKKCQLNFQRMIIPYRFKVVFLSFLAVLFVI